MDNSEIWAELVADWEQCRDALASFPLFKDGWMQNDRLDRYEVLRDALDKARARMDAFIANYRRGYPVTA